MESSNSLESPRSPPPPPPPPEFPEPPAPPSELPVESDEIAENSEQESESEVLLKVSEVKEPPALPVPEISSSSPPLVNSSSSSPSAVAAPPSPPESFKVGDMALCWYNDLLYEAVIQSIKRSSNPDRKEFLLHYPNWENQWDEWVTEDLLRKYDAPGRKLALKLYNEYKKKNPVPQANKREKRSSSAEGKTPGPQQQAKAATKDSKDSKESKESKKISQEDRFSRAVTAPLSGNFWRCPSCRLENSGHQLACCSCGEKRKDFPSAEKKNSPDDATESPALANRNRGGRNPKSLVFNEAPPLPQPFPPPLSSQVSLRYGDEFFLFLLHLRGFSASEGASALLIKNSSASWNCWNCSTGNRNLQPGPPFGPPPDPPAFCTSCGMIFDRNFEFWKCALCRTRNSLKDASCSHCNNERPPTAEYHPPPALEAEQKAPSAKRPRPSSAVPQYSRDRPSFVSHSSSPQAPGGAVPPSPYSLSRPVKSLKWSDERRVVMSLF